VELCDRFVAIIYLHSLDSGPKQPSIIPCQMSAENWIRARFFSLYGYAHLFTQLPKILMFYEICMRMAHVETFSKHFGL